MVRRLCWYDHRGYDHVDSTAVTSISRSTSLSDWGIGRAQADRRGCLLGGGGGGGGRTLVTPTGGILMSAQVSAEICILLVLPATVKHHLKMVGLRLAKECDQPLLFGPYRRSCKDP